MATSWVQVLVDPPSVIASAGPDEQRKSAIALLLDGRLDDYERRAPDAGLPAFASATAEARRDGESRLVAAISLLVGGHREALDGLSSIAASPEVESGIRSIAAILSGAALSDSGRPDLALPLLDERARDVNEPAEKALLDVHWAFRAAECGLFAEAEARSTAAGDATDDRSEPHLAIQTIARHNAAQFGWIVGHAVPPDMPRRADSKAIAWIDLLAVDALEDYLDGHFKAFFEQPFTRSVTFAREDQTDRGLSRSLFRAECLADWQGVARARKSLGRYRLLSEAGRSSPGAAFGFEQLRRGRDVEGLDRALSVFRAAGPLEPLRGAGDRVSSMPWWPIELRADLSILEHAATALDAAAVERALDRILGSLPDMLRFVPGSGWVVDPIMKALAALAPPAGPLHQRRMSRAIRELASAPPDPMVHQSIGRVLHSLDWERLGRTEVRLWLGYVQDNLGARDDHVFPAMAAAHELMSLHPIAISRVALAAFRETRSLYLVSLLLRRGSLRSDDRQAVENAVIDLAQSMRREASAGRYTMGLIRVGGLLGRLALTSRRRGLFDEALDFAMDPKVSLDERIATVVPFIAEPGEVPSRHRRRLAAGLPAAQIGMPIFGTQADLLGVNLQLEAVFGDVNTSVALSHLLRLAHSPSQEARLQAIRSLGVIRGSLDSSTLAAVLIGLSHDPDPFVRAAAGNALGAATVDVAPELRQARISELLEEPGELVPRAVWLGLAQSRRSGEAFETELDARASRVAAAHIAYTVRAAAAAFLAASEQRG